MSDFKSKTSAFFNRTIQKAGEAFNTADKTVLDPALEKAIHDCDLRSKLAHKILGFVESVTQPNPMGRMEDKFRQGVNRPIERMNEIEALGNCFVECAHELGSGPNSNMMADVGRAEMEVGVAMKNFSKSVDTNYAQWLREFIATDAKQAKQAKTDLEHARLDYDHIRGQHSKAKDHRKQQELSQSLNSAEAKFRSQCDTTRRQLEDCIQKFDANQDELRSFVDAQKAFYASCSQALSRLN